MSVLNVHSDQKIDDAIAGQFLDKCRLAMYVELIPGTKDITVTPLVGGPHPRDSYLVRGAHLALLRFSSSKSLVPKKGIVVYITQADQGIVHEATVSQDGVVGALPGNIKVQTLLRIAKNKKQPNQP